MKKKLMTMFMENKGIRETLSPSFPQSFNFLRTLYIANLNGFNFDVNNNKL